MNAKTYNPQGSVFVVMPIGDNGSAKADRSRKVYDYLIRPTCESRGLRCVRADEIASPGSVIEQIRRCIAKSEVVIADLTGHNPNVTYEVGWRHGAGGKVILVAKHIKEVPFDLRTERVIIYDLRTAGGLIKARHDLEKALDEVLNATPVEA